MWSRYGISLLLLIILGSSVQGIDVILVVESTQKNLTKVFDKKFPEVETLTQKKFSYELIEFQRSKSDDIYADLCTLLASGKYSAVIDMAWGGWIKGRKTANSLGLPYLRIEAANHLFVQAADDFLKSQKAVDAALIFEDQNKLDQSLYYIIGNSFLRIIGAQLNDTGAFDRLKKMRPRPSNYVVWGSSLKVKEAYTKALGMDMLKRDTRWTLVFQDFKHNDFSLDTVMNQTNFLQMEDPENCCIIMNKIGTNCDCSNMNDIPTEIVGNGMELFLKALSKMDNEGTLPKQAWTCDNPSSGNNATRAQFDLAVGTTVNATAYLFKRDKHNVPLITAPIKIKAKSENQTGPVLIGDWNPVQRFVQAPGYSLGEIKDYFRVGVVLGMPWAWIEGAPDPIDTKYLDDSMPNRGLKGYCIELLEELAKRMKFDYEIVPSNRNAYGAKQPNGTWTGIVGDLISGEIDISVATLTMTTEREEVIDFVAPYFDQSGISILLRKKEPVQSIFKFMSVLKTEVWLGILAAVFIVAFLIWCLDRFSPYSYYNNKDAYPEGARDFTLGESLWFSLTSLTPQGGGECPKALSGRVLVAAYWLFIVLMLATFTANLAAFLTVERMQTTVQSLEELARQSKINYTVVSNSPYMEYFENMAGAEDELYKKWKEITLNSTSDQTRYRVWDYPVREQYTHILKVIKQNEPVATPEEGFQRVDNDLEANFAFIHDASEVRYKYYQNCNFTEIGEPFAEQPLAVAVQQGSHLQKEISKIILELQKERYFETLSGKYWNSSKRASCPVKDDSQGITLKSLGGIFLATLCGLLLSMITLAYEVWQQKKQDKNKVHEIDKVIAKSGQSKIITVGSKQVALDARSGFY